LGKEANRTCCEAMKGLIRESEMIIDASGDSAVRDAALITAAQRIEHYEMAGYGTARSIADQLGYTEIAHTLQLTLEEEKKADRQLTKIAESWINVQAARV
jgi:ferritin-like metal-binding protein YciE